MTASNVRDPRRTGALTKIVVAMSGGVDSSVAAALLAEQGHDVVGVSMQLYDQSDGQQHFGSCCTLDDLYDARRVAAAIGIPHYIVNFEEHFQSHVIGNFVAEYSAGRTPIPCAHCNADLKFSTLLQRARGYGAETLATGHYARIDCGADGRRQLRRGLDSSRDQTYFLFSLTQAQLQRAAFPVGGLDKGDVRRHAERLGLQVADKAESRELCFVPDGHYADFIERTAPAAARPGTLVQQDGVVVGSHAGVHRFTVGQRKGLGLSTSEPLYVLELRPASAEIVVGPREALSRTTLEAAQVNWIGDPPASDHTVLVQIRYQHHASPARVTLLDGQRMRVDFESPQSAITPGQAVVCYDGDVCLGGGWIE